MRTPNPLLTGFLENCISYAIVIFILALLIVLAFWIAPNYR